MRRILIVSALAGLLLHATSASAQANAANYAFATTTTGSLTDMSSGTTQLVAANLDDAVSAVTAIGFDFFLMGARQTQFSVNSNGSLRLGSTVVSTTAYNPLGVAATSVITAYAADQRTHTTGKVHFKVTGSAPNRVLAVEWLNMQANFNSGGTADLTYQVHLYETTGAIEFVYGSMTMSVAGAADAGSLSPEIGFSSGNTAGTVGSITAPQSGTPDPTFNGALALPTENTYVAGAIAALTSAADGSRRTFLLTPAAANPPGGPMTFTGVTVTGMTLNWTDSSNELGYAVYVSTDGGATFSFAGTAAQNAITYAATGLFEATPYTWNVYAYTEGGVSSLSGSQATPAATSMTTTGAGGLWSSTGTWSTGIVPTSNDAVTIGAGATVTIDAAAQAYNLTVAGTGLLQYEAVAARTLTVVTNVNVQSGGTFQADAVGTLVHGLTVGGNLTNGGTLNFFTAGPNGVGITFTGAQNAALSGGGATTDIYGITLNKGTSAASILEVMPTSFTVRGAAASVSAWLTSPVGPGTLKLSGTFTGSSPVFSTAAYTISATGGFWLNNPNYTVNGQAGSPTTSGLLRITQGTFNIGTGTGNSMGFSAGSTIIVEGGAVNATGRFGVASSANAFTYNQSAGTITVCTAGNSSTTLASFDLGTSLSSSITMSGGTIVVQLASTAVSGPRDYRNSAGAGIAGVTGGTLQLGNAASGAAKAFNIGSVVPNLVVSNASAGHSATFLTAVNYNDISLNITINTGSTLNIVNGVFLFNGTTLTNDGTLVASGASCRFIFFRPATAHIYAGSGTVTAPMTSLELQDDIGLTISPASLNIVVSRIILFSGGITNANKLTLGNGAATTGTVQIGNTTTPTAAGTFDVPLTFNLGTGGQVLSYLRTTSARTTGGEINPARTLTTFTYDDNDVTHSLTLSGGGLTVTGVTSLTNGHVITGVNTLAIAGTGSVTRTAGQVDGNLRKTFTAAGPKTFEVGSTNGYSPVAVNMTAGTFPADFTASATQSFSPGIFPTSSAITRYWTLNATGVTADLTFSYLDADLNSLPDETLLHVFRREILGTYTDLGGVITAAANTAAVTGVTAFSEWTLALAGTTPVELIHFSVD